MRTQTFIVSMASALVFAGAAQASVAPIVIDNYTSAGGITGDGVGYAQWDGAFSTATWTTNPSYLGSRLLETWGSVDENGVPYNGSMTSTMNGNGHWLTSIDAGDSGNNTFVAQYKLNSNLDLTGKAVSLFGSGSASGGGWTELNAQQTGSGYYQRGYSIGVQLFVGADNDGLFLDSVNFELKMYGSQTFGNFTFTVADFQTQNPTSTFDFTNVNAIQVYMNANGSFETETPNGMWNYDATGLQITAVPAPGAAALVGLAGLVATRRRRN